MSFYVCLGARGGGFSTQGYGFADEGATHTFPWWVLTGSSQARAWILPAFGLGIGVEAMYTLLDRNLVVYGSEGSQMRKAVARFGLAVSVGPVFRFF